MGVPDLPPDFTKPFVMVGNFPSYFIDWIKKKGQVTVATGVHDAAIGVSYYPNDRGLHLDRPPYYVIHDRDVLEVSRFFVVYYDLLMEQLVKYKDSQRSDTDKHQMQMNVTTQCKGRLDTIVVKGNSMDSFTKAYFRSLNRSN